MVFTTYAMLDLSLFKYVRLKTLSFMPLKLFYLVFKRLERERERENNSNILLFMLGLSLFNYDRLKTLSLMLLKLLYLVFKMTGYDSLSSHQMATAKDSWPPYIEVHPFSCFHSSLATFVFNESAFMEFYLLPFLVFLYVETVLMFFY